MSLNDLRAWKDQAMMTMGDRVVEVIKREGAAQLLVQVKGGKLAVVVE